MARRTATAHRSVTRRPGVLHLSSLDADGRPNYVVSSSLGQMELRKATEFAQQLADRHQMPMRLTGLNRNPLTVNPS